MIKRDKKSAGDTIIEVMIAVAILALGLSVAYSISGRSLKSAITANERSQALSYLKRQIEFIKVASTSDPAFDNKYNAAPPFCLDYRGVLFLVNVPNSSCVDYDGSIYKIEVLRKGLPISAFVATATWDNINGGPQNSEVLYYRVIGF